MLISRAFMQTRHTYHCTSAWLRFWPMASITCMRKMSVVGVQGIMAGYSSGPSQNITKTKKNKKNTENEVGRGENTFAHQRKQLVIFPLFWWKDLLLCWVAVHWFAVVGDCALDGDEPRHEAAVVAHGVPGYLNNNNINQKNDEMLGKEKKRKK